MKILYYLPSLYTPGGLERIITYKANYMAENFKEYEVYVVTSEQMGHKLHYPLSPKVVHIDLNVAFDWPFNQSRLTKLLKYPFRYFKFRKRFERLLMELRPDITISTLRRELRFLHQIKDGSIKIGEFHVTRYAYGVGNDKDTHIINRILKKKWDRAFIQNLNKLDRLVLLTKEETANWPELHNICVIPNPIITPRSQLSDTTSRQVIAAGRYAPQKGFDLLIESWSLVARRHPDWQLRIYGEGTLRPVYQKRIDELGLTNCCILEPTVTDIVAKYCESSIFVLSSRYEGFGMVLTEAMACGIPPVSFACPCGPKDIITDGIDGLLVERENIQQLAEKICYLIEHENLRKEMGRKAQISSQRFQMEYIGKQWKELFETLLLKK